MAHLIGSLLVKSGDTAHEKKWQAAAVPIHSSHVCMYVCVKSENDMVA